MRWVWERTGLNLFEQKRAPASVMRAYRRRYLAGLAAAAQLEGGIGEVLRRGW